MKYPEPCHPEYLVLLPGVFAFFIHVLDRGLVDHQVGRTGAVHFEAALVIPLDYAVNFLAVAEHNDHRSSRLHLLLVVEIFRIGLLGWWRLAAAPVSVIAIAPVVAIERALG